MTRNLKKSNLKKLSEIITSNNFKIDIANYIYNPSHDHEYPSFRKLITEDEDQKHFITLKYFKHYSGNGEYIKESYTSKKNKDGNSWSITTNNKSIKLEESIRFSLKRLRELTELEGEC